MSEQNELRRDMGLAGAISVVAGGVIGSGIFLKPWSISRSLENPMMIHLLWAGLGIVCLFGAFAYAELGCRFPEAGGQYAFLREGWGRFIAFLYGWCFFLVINTGTVAALAAAFANTASGLAGFKTDSPQRDALAVGMVLVLATVNHFGVRWGSLLMTASSAAKVLALTALIVGGLFAANTSSVPAVLGDAPSSVGVLAGIVSACIGIFWAYEGWYQLPFNAAELKDPQRNLPRGLVWGTIIVIVIYVAANAVYLKVVPFDEMRRLGSEPDVPRLAIQRIFGSGAGNLLSYFLCLSIFGAANPSLLSSPRAMYAMSKDGLLPHWFMKVHPKYRTPSAAIWTQALWSVVLLMAMKKFDDLTVYVVFAALIFYALTVAAIYIVRRRNGGGEPAYRCWGYPVTPIVFILVCLFVDGYTLYGDPNERRNALIGLAIIAAGIPVYLVFGRKKPAA